MSADWKLIQQWAGVAADGQPGPATARAIIAKAGIEPVTKTYKLADPAAFFAEVKNITGSLDQVQVNTVNGLLKAAAHWPLSWLAYGLATAWHEARLRPIHELGGPKYLAKYDTGALAKALGNTPEADGDGIKYAGRGLVQLTGRTNYQNASEYLGFDLLSNPELALSPTNATRILVWGMEIGAFTGKGLADYLPEDRGAEPQFRQARRIINGVDRAGDIALLAMRFQQALFAGRWA